MPLSTFSVFLDENVSSQAASNLPSTSSRKHHVLHHPPAPAIKENINPLTGLSFDAQPPLKKRKPSSSSALKVKPLPSSSKPVSKSKRHLSSNSCKATGKKRAVLGASENANTGVCMEGLRESDAEQSRAALGNRRAYDFTVMPLADVTQAYDESEATRATTGAGLVPIQDTEPITSMALEKVVEENDVQMHDMTSKEAILTTAVIITEA